MFESKESIKKSEVLGPDSAEAKQKYEMLLGQKDESEIENLFENKENLNPQIQNGGDRFIPIRNTSFDCDLNQK